jgi:hypothetical protein
MVRPPLVKDEGRRTFEDIFGDANAVARDAAERWTDGEGHPFTGNAHAAASQPVSAVRCLQPPNEPATAMARSALKRLPSCIGDPDTDHLYKRPRRTHDDLPLLRY